MDTVLGNVQLGSCGISPGEEAAIYQQNQRMSLKDRILDELSKMDDLRKWVNDREIALRGVLAAIESDPKVEALMETARGL